MTETELRRVCNGDGKEPPLTGAEKYFSFFPVLDWGDTDHAEWLGFQPDVRDVDGREDGVCSCQIGRNHTK